MHQQWHKREEKSHELREITCAEHTDKISRLKGNDYTYPAIKREFVTM